MAQRQHTHHIDVQTDEPIVTVSIGSEGTVPGGFAKLFNRVVDSQVWGQLSDAARAIYVPLVRFADHRNQFRVRMGQAAIMKYSGLSRSSTKRAIKDLLQHKLIVVVERGGVSESGENESSTYQLLVPAERRNAAASVRSVVNPQGVQRRTPSMAPQEPPEGPTEDPPESRQGTGRGVERAGSRGFTSGPQLRTEIKETNNRVGALLEPPSPMSAAALLEKAGVERAIARQLADQFPRERIVDVIANMEWRRARGKCDNPGGFIRDALVRQWQTPRHVVETRAKAEARERANVVEQKARLSAAREQSNTNAEEVRIERMIDALDDEDLQLLAKSVREKYRGNTAVTAVLNRKPPRECRLMKMEIAAMLSSAPMHGQMQSVAAQPSL